MMDLKTQFQSLDLQGLRRGMWEMLMYHHPHSPVRESRPLSSNPLIWVQTSRSAFSNEWLTLYALTRDLNQLFRRGTNNLAGLPSIRELCFLFTRSTNDQQVKAFLLKKLTVNTLNIKEVVNQVRDLLKLNKELIFERVSDTRLWDQLVLFTAFGQLTKLVPWEQWAVDAIARRYDAFPLVYRFDSQGNIVALTQSQRDKIKSRPDLPTLYVNNTYLPRWGDDEEQTVIFIPQVSREITQVKRRISQFVQGPVHQKPFALIYFGVKDNGEMCKPGQFTSVWEFANSTYVELLNEGFNVDIAGLTGTHFGRERKSFPTFEESEEGHVEYKSTGDHKPREKHILPKFLEGTRVIKFKVTYAKDESQDPFPNKITARQNLILPEVHQHSYTFKEVTLFEDSPICTVSRTRPACWTKPGFRNLDPQTQRELRYKDNQQIKSVKSFGKLLEAFNTALTVCRQHPKVQRTEAVIPVRARGKRKQPSLRCFDLSNPDDEMLFREITYMNEFLIRYFNEHGLDKTIDLVKESAAEVRVMWQVGDAQLESKANWLTYLVVPYISHIYTVNTYNDATGAVVYGWRYHMASYSCCVYGYLGRALPRPTDEKVEKARWETYERFAAKQIVDPETISEITEWSREFFSQMESPDAMPLESAGVGGCLERQRSKGGVADYLSQMYKECKKLTPAELVSKGLPKTAVWREGFVDRILQPGDILHFHNEGSVFAWCFAHDVLREFLDHAPKCTRHLKCMEPEKHLPMIPLGIAEPGGKARIPCVTSGLLNILATPIREAMFRIIRSDPRCKYRTSGATDKQLPMIDKFLDSLSKNDITHSGDMTVSTDAFPLQFMEAVINGLPMDQKWKDIALLCTGPFKMVAPSKENEDILRHNRVRSREFPTVHIIDHVPVFLGRMFKPSWLKREDRYLPEVEVEDITYDGIRMVGKHRVILPERTIKQHDLNDPMNNRHRHKTAGLGYSPYSTTEQKDDSYWMDSELASSVKIDPVPKYDLLTEARKPLMTEWDSSYVTTSGLQMATACSITMLYAFNLFCDEWARSQPGAIGKSLLCGDDSLRSGNEVYIDGYKFKAKDLYAIFSLWKDVTAKNARGVFTELYMEEKEVLRIPKLKTIIRPKGSDGVSPWKKAIQAVKTLRTCDDAALVHLQEEMLYKYRNVLAEHEGLLPFGVEQCVGGNGALFEPLQGRNKSTWERIKSHPHVYTRFKLSRMFMRSLTPYTVHQAQKLPHIDAFSRAKPILNGFASYLRGSARWLSDQETYLRGMLSAAAVMVDPPKPVVFANEKAKNNIKGLPQKSGLIPYSVRKHFETLDEIDQMLTEDGVCEPRTGVSSPTDLAFYDTTHHADFPTSIVGQILGPSMAAKPIDF